MRRLSTGSGARDTFQLADAFVALDLQNLEHFKRDVYRFLDLIFGDPFETPTRDEHAMFLAYAASLRSADLSRQVGAVVVSSTHEVIATGWNDVPSYGGSLFGPGHHDRRDHIRGKDSNKAEIKKIKPADSAQTKLWHEEEAVPAWNCEPPSANAGDAFRDRARKSCVDEEVI